MSQLLSKALEPLSLNAGPGQRADTDCALMHLIMAAAAMGSTYHSGGGCQEGENHYLIRSGLIFFLAGVVGSMPTAPPPHLASSALPNQLPAYPVLLTEPMSTYNPHTHTHH